MSTYINAEIAMRRHDVIDQLNEANPSVEPLVEAIENELEYVFDNFYDSFDEMFHDNGIALHSYDDLTDRDEDTVLEWQSEFLDRAIQRWTQKLAARVMATQESESV